MSREALETLAARLEKMAEHNPTGYRLRVAALALLCYAYIIAVLTLDLALIIALIVAVVHTKAAHYFFLKLALPLLLLSYLIFKSFQVRFAEPEGLAISAKESPKLFALLNELKSKLNCPRIHSVYLNMDFNAAVYSMPRYAFLGAHRHYLHLGLPLMQSLSAEQFRAVLAHELGHLSGNHGKFSSWIYSLRSTSSQLFEYTKQQSALGNLIFGSFFRWYYPIFNAYSFALLRQHEFEADKSAAEIAGPATAAMSLINSEIKSRYIELKFWKEFFSRIDNHPQPPQTTFHDLAVLMTAAEFDEETYSWYQQALRKKTDMTETHPCLLDRIKSISMIDGRETFDKLSREELQDSWQIKKSAAEEYFENSLPDLENRLGSIWQQSVAPGWTAEYKERSEAKETLSLIESKDAETLTDEELLKKCSLYVKLKPETEYVPVLRDALKRLPEDPYLNYSYGAFLLEEGDFAGLENLEKVINSNPELAYDICRRIHEKLTEEGEEERAKIYGERLQHFQKELERAAIERSGLTEKDRYKAHSLTGEQVEKITMNFSEQPKIKRAFLVCKEVQTFNERPFYVLILEMKKHSFREFDPSKETRKLLVELGEKISMPSEGYVIPLEWAPNKLKKALKQIPNALIYERENKPKKS